MSRRTDALRLLIAIEDHGIPVALHGLYAAGIRDGDEVVRRFADAGVDPVDLEAALLGFEDEVPT